MRACRRFLSQGPVMSTTYYRQCRLEKPVPTGIIQQTAWIPEQFAKLGRSLRIRVRGAWDHGWIVAWVGQGRNETLVVPDGFGGLPDPHRQIKAHRRNTGDALPTHACRKNSK